MRSITRGCLVMSCGGPTVPMMRRTCWPKRFWSRGAGWTTCRRGRCRICGSMGSRAGSWPTIIGASDVVPSLPTEFATSSPRGCRSRRRRGRGLRLRPRFARCPTMTGRCWRFMVGRGLTPGRSRAFWAFRATPRGSGCTVRACGCEPHLQPHMPSRPRLLRASIVRRRLGRRSHRPASNRIQRSDCQLTSLTGS